MLKSFAANQRGNVAMMFAIAALPLIAATGGAIDYSRAYQQRIIVQDALDAAALAANKMIGIRDEAGVRQEADDVFEANINGQTDRPISFDMALGDGSVTLTTQLGVPTHFLGILGIDDINFNLTAESVSGGTNVEVSLVLDVTGSMAGDKIADLRAAATALVNQIVRDDQSPYYSRVALVPYSVGVNVGTLADQVRGPVTAAKTITNVTRANPAIVTSANHGFANGDIVYISGVAGMPGLSGTYTVANRTANTFALQGVNGSNLGTYSRGGTASCTTAGCQYYRFQTPSDGPRTNRISTCVSERTGASRYTDLSWTISPVGRNYPFAANGCPSTQLVPLTDDTGYLTRQIASFQATGTTAGQIGVAWGWYTLSPSFGNLGGYAPASYSEDDVMKIAVLMTDGEFNTGYCNGVISRDSTASGNDRINCNATNGSSFNQARNLCDAMKRDGITVYTVGFQLGREPAAVDVMEDCASDADHAYLAEDGEELMAAFNAIGTEISQLRLAR